jgi:hypothetical protein
MPDSSPSPAAPASYGSRDAVPAHASSAVNRPQKRRVRLPHAEADLNFAAPLQHQTRQRIRKIQEIPANADVAQLVEHFTRNEGVPGSSPGVGSRWICRYFLRRTAHGPDTPWNTYGTRQVAVAVSLGRLGTSWNRSGTHV